MKTSLNQNMITLINEFLSVGVPINGKPVEIKDIENITYNSYNETLYIETEEKYIVIEAINPLQNFITEFPKTDDQKRAKTMKNIKGGVNY